MMPTGTNSHKFSPNGDILAHVDVVKVEKRFLGIKYPGTKLRLREDHVYNGPTFYMLAPKGYEFDGATVPRLLWWLFERYGVWTRAALFHDLQYDRRIGTRAAADALFREIMELDEVPWYASFPMWLGVRLWPLNILYWRRRPKKRGSGYKKTGPR